MSSPRRQCVICERWHRSRRLLFCKACADDYDENAAERSTADAIIWAADRVRAIATRGRT